MNPPPGSRTAFVLAGGGSLGAVQVGMLKALAHHRISPDFVVGASVGALNGACYAAEPCEAGIARLERTWLRLRRRDIFPLTMRGMALCLLGRRDHLALPHRLGALIEAELPCRRLEDTRLPCHVVATDVLDGTEVVLSSGESAAALLASTALPAVFPPVAIDGRALMDGGIASNTPIAAAVSLGATRVFVLPTGSPCAMHAPPRGAFAMALHALNLLAMRQLLADIDRFAGRCDLVVVPPLCPLAIHAYDFSRTRTLIARAEAATRAWLVEGIRHEDPRWALLPHRHHPVPAAG
jgi:NTE family protein